MEILKKYQEQYEEFCKIDDFTLEDRAKRVPAEKHFWVCRLLDAKIERDRLYKRKAALKIQMQKAILEDSPVLLNKQVMDDVAKSPSVTNLDQKIKEYDFLIEYLEKLVSNITFISQDIKNIIELKKLQEQ